MLNTIKKIKRARETVGKIAKEGVYPIPGTSRVMVESWALADKTGLDQIALRTKYAIFDSQASYSKIHGYIIDFHKVADKKKAVIIDNILPARRWAKGKHWRHEFREGWITQPQAK
jgi:hypothetical protein